MEDAIGCPSVRAVSRGWASATPTTHVRRHDGPVPSDLARLLASRSFGGTLLHQLIAECCESEEESAYRANGSDPLRDRASLVRIEHWKPRHRPFLPRRLRLGRERALAGASRARSVPERARNQAQRGVLTVDQRPRAHGQAHRRSPIRARGRTLKVATRVRIPLGVPYGNPDQRPRSYSGASFVPWSTHHSPIRTYADPSCVHPVQAGHRGPGSRSRFSVWVSSEPGVGQRGAPAADEGP